MRTEQRTWAGTTMAERRAARRERFLDAGIALLATEGPSGATVRAACRTAQLTERYFYESFADRDAFVVAVYEHVAEQARGALVAAVQQAPAAPAELARAGVTAFVELILDDPRKGSVLLLAPMADPALIRRGTELLPAFTALIQAQLPASLDDTARELTAVGLAGALTNLFTRYLDGSLDVPRDRLVDHCVRILLRSAPRG